MYHDPYYNYSGTEIQPLFPPTPDLHLFIRF